jgi:serine/threonine protein kinase
MSSFATLACQKYSTRPTQSAGHFAVPHPSSPPVSSNSRSRRLSRLRPLLIVFFEGAEVLLDVGYSYPADWWSLGVLLFEMCFGWSPFYAESRIEEYERILQMEIKIPNKRGYGPEVKDLLLKVS